MIPHFTKETTITTSLQEKNVCSTVDGLETEKDMSIVFSHSNRGELGNVLYAGAGTLKCQECGVSCSSGKDVEKHLQGVHNAGVTCYTCRGCGRRFERLTQVACHFPTVEAYNYVKIFYHSNTSEYATVVYCM